MSEPLPILGDDTAIWRVKKSPDNSIYGPVDIEMLKEWAHSAQIAPEDEIDQSDEKWRPAPEFDFLEMLWLVKLAPVARPTAPTTVGTLREFINEGLVTDTDPCLALQDAPVAAPGRAGRRCRLRAQARRRRPSREANKSTASLAVERAKDQHIRQLEEDLKELRREHEALTHEYRRLQMQLQEAATAAPLKPRRRFPPWSRRPRPTPRPTGCCSNGCSGRSMSVPVFGSRRTPCDGDLRIAQARCASSATVIDRRYRRPNATCCMRAKCRPSCSPS
ncbi:MAG: bZIP transcription factor [Verrucomicrobiota bacterium]